MPSPKQPDSPKGGCGATLPMPDDVPRNLAKYCKNFPTKRNSTITIRDRDGDERFYRVFPYLLCEPGEEPERLTPNEAKRRALYDRVKLYHFVAHPCPSGTSTARDPSVVPWARWYASFYEEWGNTWTVSRRDGSDLTEHSSFAEACTRLATLHPVVPSDVCAMKQVSPMPNSQPASELASLPETFSLPASELPIHFDGGLTFTPKNDLTARLHVILVCGFARAGKDTAAGIITRWFEGQGQRVFSHRFAGPLKREFAMALCRLLQQAGASQELIQQGHDLVFTEDTALKSRSRPGVVSLGTACGRYLMDDIFVAIAANDIKARMGKDQVVVIPDFRFANEFTRLKELLPPQVEFTRIWVERPGVGPVNDDEAQFTAPLKDECLNVVNDSNVEALGHKLTPLLQLPVDVA